MFLLKTSVYLEYELVFPSTASTKMKRKSCPYANLPMPKWPRLEALWSEKDVAEAEMINSLHIEAPKEMWEMSLRRSLKMSAACEIVHTHTFETEVYASRHFLTWTRLIEALDLANFDKDMVKLRSIADAWKPLPVTCELQ